MGNLKLMESWINEVFIPKEAKYQEQYLISFQKDKIILIKTGIWDFGVGSSTIRLLDSKAQELQLTYTITLSIDRQIEITIS